MRTRRGFHGVLKGVLSCLLACTLARPETASESQLKAAFLYHFTKFVEWPADASALLSDNAISVCTIGDDTLGSALEDSLRDKRVRNHSLVIRHLKNSQTAANCNVLFISNSESRKLAEIFASVASGNVLTVGESPGFTKRGGCIEFVVDSNRIHFVVNLAAARRSGLRISSELLSLADSVEK
jgi:YfiR/HmsC-like